MTSKEYLKQIYFLTQAIEDEESEIKMIQICADGMTGMGFDKEMIKDSIPVSGIETNYLKIEMLKEKIEKQRGKLKQIKEDATKRIALMRNERERKILKLKYFDFLSWEQIMSEFETDSKDAVYSLHRRALSHFPMKHNI